MRIFFVTGYKYSGKTYFSKKFAERINAIYFSTGDFCRENKLEIKDYLATNNNLVIDVVKKTIYDNIFLKDVVIDGFPRNIQQVDVIEKYFPNAHIFMFKVDFKTAESRANLRNEQIDFNKWYIDKKRIDNLIKSIKNVYYQIVHTDLVDIEKFGREYARNV